MGFKENLKSELQYKDMMVKELALKTGISRHTIDNYLNVRSHTPTIEAAVKIAKALDVSVEFLVTGAEPIKDISHLSNEDHCMLQNFKLLNETDKKIIIELIELFNKHRRKL